MKRNAIENECYSGSYDKNIDNIYAFVSSRIDNCNSLLYGLPKHSIAKLQNVQNAAARVIAGLREFDHISPTLRELHWLPMEYRIIFKINLLTFKSLPQNLAPNLQELLEHLVGNCIHLTVVLDLIVPCL